MPDEVERTITIAPNYPAIFERFMQDAMLHLNHLAEESQDIFSRKEVYDLVASLRIALGSATNVAEIVKLREQFDAGAEKMFAEVSRGTTPHYRAQR